MLASVVDLPEPVGPVTSTSPRGSSDSRSDDVRQAEFLNRDRPDGHPTKHQPDRAPRPEGVHPEPAQTGDRVPEVHLGRSLELGAQVRTQYLLDHGRGVLGG